MLSPVATMLLTWAAIYAYVGLSYCLLHLRRPTHREYLAFGMLCMAMALFAAGSVLLLRATSVAAAAFAVRLQYVGGLASVPLCVDFAAALSGYKAQKLVRASYVVSAICIVLDAAGLLVDPTRRAPPPTWGLALASEPIEPSLTPLGKPLLAGAVGLGIGAVIFIALKSRHKAGMKPFVWVAALALFASVHDTFTRLTRLHTLYLLDTVGLVPVLAVSYLLLRRFVKSADQLAERTDELRHSYGELRVTQEELVRKEQLAAVGELSAVIAHEVRNPLAVIKNAVSSLRRSTLVASDRTVLLSILGEEVDRLARLVRDLLAYARPVEPRGRPIDPGRIIDDALRTSLANLDGPREIDLEVSSEDCPSVHGDPDLLRQAFANVADNALSAMPGGGTLRVRAAAGDLSGDAAVVVEFSDTGRGMDAEVLDKATAPFFTTRPSGTGLGLAIVDRVIKNHGGSLSIQSAPDAGTTVRMVLPRDRHSSIPPRPEDD